MNKTFKIIQLPQWGRVGLSLTIQFIFVFVLLGTLNGFASNYVPDTQTSLGVQQQKRQVSGTVSDVNGEAVIGANVIEKGTTNGTVTDLDGHFSLTVAGDAVLQISYIGYLEQEISTAGRTSFDIVLHEDTKSLDEVVVVGYGTQKKVNLTGALASVGREEIKSISTANLVTGLAGKLPGLKVTQRTGEPGSYTTSYDIRGFGAPLIVMDGIIRDGADFARLDPHDIESITILKDASAAVYGIKAANGIILVTTKKGETGKPTISYTGAYEWQRISNTPKVGTAYEYAVLTTENEINGGRAPGETTYTPDDLQKFKDGTYPSTDWYHVVARDFTTLSRHNLNISGGSDRIRYFTSIGYLGEQGLWKSGDLNYHKYNIRSNVTGKITDELEIQVNLDGMLENKNEPGEAAWNVIKFTWMNIPTYSVYANDNPEYLQDMTYPWNPVAMTTASIGGYTKTKTKTFHGNMVLNYDVPFIKGLQAKLTYGFYNKDWFQKAWRQKYSTYDYDKVNDVYILKGTQNSPSNLSANYYPTEITTFQGQLTYEKTWNEKHTIKSSVVFEDRYAKNDNLWARKEFAIDIDQFFAGLSKNAQVNSGSLYEDANQSLIGRLNYDYLSRYLFEFAFNYSGSSKFPKGKRWGFFPYTSAGWRISEEEFFKRVFPVISNLKVRASWGEMGDDGASSFQFLTGYNYPDRTYVIDDQVIPGLGFRGMPNPNITWYTVTTKNIGLDLDIKDGLLYTQFDLFRRDRTGLLATRTLTIPRTVGADLPQENLNEDMRRGFELVVGHAKRTGDLRYDISGNFTFTRGKPVHVERNPDGNSYLNWRSNPVGRWDNQTWGYRYIGQFQSEEEVLTSPIQDGQGNRTLRPGDLKYEDVNRDGIINSLDEVPIARSHIPEINYGLNINASWKQFDLNLLFQGAANFNFQYIEQMRAPLPWGRNSLSQFMDRWHHEDIYDVNSPWIPGRFPATNYPPSNNWNSEFWWPDASYLRLKNVELGYAIPQNILGKTGIQSARIFVSGFNLFTWTKIKYIDPEQDPNTYNYLYPLMKNYNMGINVTF
ncbi:SusC/RagA family TonB-linked outer membrane protein [Proteiniphilum acetatigenes]|uniref:SusC/RagA family TonB-linked outer membrane protein n=1 Tax=Proteiniphilum acetatigenes TaxID=294710 RepID=UPI0003A6409F|nr:TonB-dependent receptor [Proteiniphilum acetatigenes]